MNYKIIISLNALLIIFIGISCLNRQPLSDKYPNPFSPISQITYTIPDSSHVLIVLYNVEGKIVDTIENQIRLPGSHTIEIESLNLLAGIYFFRLQAGEFTDTKKLLILK